jgi:hypothetical protein
MVGRRGATYRESSRWTVGEGGRDDGAECQSQLALAARWSMASKLDVGADRQIVPALVRRGS